VVERAPRDRRSFDILSVKKEAKLSASEANDVQIGASVHLSVRQHFSESESLILTKFGEGFDSEGGINRLHLPSKLEVLLPASLPLLLIFSCHE